MKCWYSTAAVILLTLSFSGASAQATLDTKPTPDIREQQPKRRGLIGRYLNSIVNDSSGFETSTRIIYPILLYTPETSLEVGLSFSYLFTMGGDTSTTRYSNVVPLAFYTLRGQYGLWVTNEIFTARENWLILGYLRFQDFPLDYYGVGPGTVEAEEIRLEQIQLWVRQRIQHKIVGNWFGGLEMEYKNITRVRTDEAEKTIPEGVRNNTAVGFGPAVTYEGRHNPLNPEPGSTYFTASWMSFDRWMGSTSPFSTKTVDIRYYMPIFKRGNILAFQQYFIHQTGAPPFNLYAQLGGDMMMRGWYYGRFRDRNLWAQQVEYRHEKPFGWKRWGYTVFLSNGLVAPKLDKFSMRYMETAGGAGVRFQLFAKKDVNMRFDYAVTREGGNFYIALGESF